MQDNKAEKRKLKQFLTGVFSAMWRLHPKISNSQCKCGPFFALSFLYLNFHLQLPEQRLPFKALVTLHPSSSLLVLSVIFFPVLIPKNYNKYLSLQRYFENLSIKTICRIICKYDTVRQEIIHYHWLHSV